jgi:carboxymethylenebutenolidase
VSSLSGTFTGGTLAMKFACRRKRLRGAVSYYGRMIQPDSALENALCPILYHYAEQDPWVSGQDVQRLRELAAKYDKPIAIQSYSNAPHAFSDETRPEGYREAAATEAWVTTAMFLKKHLQGS